MRRDKIRIEGGSVTITGGDMWITSWELVELFGTTIPRMRASIRKVFKDSALKEHEHCKRITLGNGAWGEAYSLEVAMAVAFMTDTYNAHVFRQWLKRKIVADGEKPPCVVFSINGYQMFD